MKLLIYYTFNAFLIFFTKLLSICFRPNVVTKHFRLHSIFYCFSDYESSGHYNAFLNSDNYWQVYLTNPAVYHFEDVITIYAFLPDRSSIATPERACNRNIDHGENQKSHGTLKLQTNNFF